MKMFEHLRVALINPSSLGKFATIKLYYKDFLFLYFIHFKLPILSKSSVESLHELKWEMAKISKNYG